MSEFLRNLSSELEQKISEINPDVAVTEYGVVESMGDGIAKVSGLASVKAQELVRFSNGAFGIAFNLEADSIGVIILDDYTNIFEGMMVFHTGQVVSVPVGDGLIGRVIDPLGKPIDHKGPLHYDGFRPIERVAPDVIQRMDVNEPVQTGIKAIDALTPVGRGQRQLIVGDRQTGKTAIAIDTIINQKDKDLLCIYVAIGQKKSSVARTISILDKFGAMDHTIVVMASADMPAAMQYIAPFAGCAIGEEFMEKGKDALVIYDDLSKHAWAYREISLLMRRPPGREAYPGDLFYLHSRLLERAARMADKYIIVKKDFDKKYVTEADSVDGKVFDGPMSDTNAIEYLMDHYKSDEMKVEKLTESGGSLTALPIIETQLGDVSAYVPTNVISITDGQIYLEANLFYSGIRPAINAGISVSRVGGDAQVKGMKQVAGGLRLSMANYRELKAFSQFGSGMDEATQFQLTRGEHLQEVLKQPQFTPYKVEDEIVIIFAANNGYSDKIPLDRIDEWQASLIFFIDGTYNDLINTIKEEKKLTEDTESSLHEALRRFSLTWA